MTTIANQMPPALSENDLPFAPMVNAVNVLATIQKEFSNERDMLNQIIGQAQMAEMFTKFSATVTTARLAFIKENKLYRALSGKKIGDQTQFPGTWQAFCDLLGRSREQIDEDIRNLKTLGEAALENMHRMGIGYRTLRQFRKLSQDNKNALIALAESGDKEALMELTEELLNKHLKEKEGLTQQLKDTQSILDARTQILKDKNHTIDQLAEKITQLEQHRKTMPITEIGEKLRIATAHTAAQAEISIRALRPGLDSLTKHSEQSGIHHHEYLHGVLAQLERTLSELRSEFDIGFPPHTPSHNTFFPAWLADLSQVEQS